MNAQSVFRNNLLIPHERQGGVPLFVFDGTGSDATVNLDGYAIIPRDRYDAMLDALLGVQEWADGIASSAPIFQAVRAAVRD